MRRTVELPTRRELVFMPPSHHGDDGMNHHIVIYATVATLLLFLALARLG